MKSIRSTARRNVDASGGREQGATTLIVAMLLVVLLGFAALAVDVGALYAEKAQLQNGADASALAIARDCAAGSCGSTSTTASLLANGNANDGSSGVSSITFPQATTVRVETNSRDAGTGSNSFSLFFARVLGINSADVRAVAQASWGAPSSGTTLPWTMSECVFKKYLTPSQLSQLQSTGSFTGDPVPTHILLRYDTNAPTYPGCAAQNGYEPGGFGWLVTNTGCSTNISISAQVNGQPGNHFPNDPACNAVLSALMDKPALVPLFSSATGNGSNATYTLVGFGAFQVTGYKFSGSGGVNDPAAPSCTGNCRGLQGYFVRFVSLQEGMSLGGGVPNFGASVIALTG
ncbi:pilus assembly protein TadG-related protein [Arthrobacter sp. NPDC080031]|uniref:pilus assembly protein TadG-related protein n=1 Tax=Arthrobacter sp. NPDC080031 TaxID=3155918 RepID=UPI00344FD58A